MTKMTSKGQVVIPKDIREKKGIKEGEKFLVYGSEDSIILKRVKNMKRSADLEKFQKTFRSMWKTAKEKGLTKEDIEDAIKWARRKKGNNVESSS